MSGTRGSQQAQKLAEGVGKLHAEKAEEGQHDEENNAANKFGIPMNLAGLRAVQPAQNCIAIHLKSDVRTDAAA